MKEFPSIKEFMKIAKEKGHSSFSEIVEFVDTNNFNRSFTYECMECGCTMKSNELDKITSILDSRFRVTAECGFCDRYTYWYKFIVPTNCMNSWMKEDESSGLKPIPWG